MAGIGFELRKFLKEESWGGLAKTYTYAGVISSGPWVLSILGIMLVGMISVSRVDSPELVMEFLVSVTYLMSASLILTGLLQLVFTRFVADRLYENHRNDVLPNLFGAITLTTSVSAGLGILLLVFFFDQSLIYQLLMLVNFIVLCNIWIVVVFTAGMKKYKTILLVFFFSYTAIVISSFVIQNMGTNGLLIAFLAGHTILLLSLLVLTVQEYDSEELIRFDFLQRRKIFPSLIFIGLFFNLGVWIDKWIFWFTEDTSDAVSGVLRASVIYDLPIFLAYLAIIPGMASFLVKIETDFAEVYQQYFTAVESGEPLNKIESLRLKMVITIREAIYQIFKVQGSTVLIFFLLGPTIIDWLGISPLYIHLYYIDLAAVGVQVLFLAILNIFFYLDFLKSALMMTAGLLLLNTLLSLLSLQMGPMFYGYGFALSITLMTFIGIAVLSAKLNRLNYLTFMLQR